MSGLEVEYDCERCGVTGGRVSVRERGVDEDVGQWLRAAALAVGLAHSRASPRCRATHIHRLKVPLAAGGGRIGEPTQH